MHLNKKHTTLLIGVIIAITSGCTANKPKLTKDLQTEFDTPLYCDNDQLCKTMWDRATYFVNNNAGFKIQIHNDTIIETYNPSNASPKLAFSINKEPLGNNKYRIWVKAWCANIFRCQPNQHEAIARAKRYMRTGAK